MASRKEYLEAIRLRYLNGNRRTKKVILDEFCAVCGYHRKHAIRLLNKRLNELVKYNRVLVPRKRGRKHLYGDPAFKQALKRVWRETDYMCSKNLKEAIPEWLPFVEKHCGAFEAQVKIKLLKVSAATIDRILEPERARWGKGRSGTKPGTLLRTQIPIRTNHWDAECPGHMEADTVAHCGDSLKGQFVWSVTMTDIFSQWTEVRAMWHKSALAALEQVKDIEQTVPFMLLSFDSDNGGEFLNKYFVRYFAERDNIVYFTRSRPYRKNDNAHVEQKNWTHVRQLLGYKRIDNLEVVEPLNRILKRWSLLRNHFYPCRKLLSKKRVGAKNFKLYDTPKTPYERLLSSHLVPDNTKEKLKQIHASLDPCSMRRNINSQLRELFKFSSVTSFYEESNTYHASLQ